MARRNAVKLRWLLPLMAVVLLAAFPAHAQWQIASIAPTGLFRAPPALTFDSQNRPVVAYEGGVGVQVTNGTPSGSMPTWTMPANVPYFGWMSGVGVIHLATAGGSVYAGCTSYGSYNGLQRAVFDGLSWQELLADYGPNGWADPVLGGMATDSSGQVNWIYNPAGPCPATSSPGTGYRLLTQTGPTTTVTNTVVSGMQNALGSLHTEQPNNILRMDGDMTFDRRGNLHTVQYYEIGSNGFLMYAKGQPGGSFVVDDNVDAGWWAKTGRPSIAVDAAGKAHIAYTTLWPYYQLNYLTQSATGWDRQTIDLGGAINGYVGTFPDVLIDPQGAVHVVYADGLNGLLKHAELVGSQWQIETIDTIGKQSVYGPQVGALAAALDGYGNIGVAYWSGAEGTLKYAYLVPEPATLALLALASGVLLRRRR